MKNSLKVLKFGGTSLENPDKINQISDRIISESKKGHSLVVVVSAMGETTDHLLMQAHQVTDQPSHREMDMLLSAGERISMALLSMALHHRNQPAVSFTGSQVGIITTAHHRRAKIKKILGDRVRHELSCGKVVIVAGFQGVSEEKEITTLGRGGSDTTAVALAVALEANECEICTDVNGVYSANPMMIAEALFYPEVSSGGLLSFSRLGAKLIHPRAIELACRYQVPLTIRSSFNQGEGTVVKYQDLEQASFRGVTSSGELFLVSVQCERQSVLASLWEELSSKQFEVILPQYQGAEVRFYSARESIQELKNHLNHLSREGFVRQYELCEELVPVSCVGEGLNVENGALSQCWSALEKVGISSQYGVSHPLGFTFSVALNRMEEATKVLHQLWVKKES